MKNIVKLIGIIAVVAVIGLLFAACSDDNGNGGGGGGIVGTWTGSTTIYGIIPARKTMVFSADMTFTAENLYGSMTWKDEGTYTFEGNTVSVTHSYEVWLDGVTDIATVNGTTINNMPVRQGPGTPQSGTITLHKQ